jgi:bifunctional non-homologous end joining protein LigD
VCVYSLRARERPTISTPLDWESVQRGARRRDAQPASLEPGELLASVERDGDRFAAALAVTQELPDLTRAGQRG